MLQLEYRPAGTPNAQLDAVAQRVNANDEAQGGAITAGEASSSPEAVTVAKSWRDFVTVHPAAEFFPMMPDNELLALGKDIEQHGLRERLSLFKPEEDGPSVLLDGRNRLDAIERAVEDPEKRNKLLEYAFGRANVYGDHIDPAAFVISLNAHRRHLTSEQKRELVAELVKRYPGKSDRAIAAVAKVDHKTVAPIRAAAEARGEIPHAEARTDKTGRQQAARKATNSGPCQPRPSSGQVRAIGIKAFLKTLHAEPTDTLQALQKILEDKGDWFSQISREKRISLARGFLSVLDVGLDELQEQNDGGQQ